MEKLQFRKIDHCGRCSYYFINHLNKFEKRCVFAAKTIDTTEIPEWCPLPDYIEKTDVNESGSVWVKIK